MELQFKDYVNFKCLLEYFVAHIEAYKYLKDKDVDPAKTPKEKCLSKLKKQRGSSILNKSWNNLPNIGWSGQTFKDDRIDKQISQWSVLNSMMRIGIAIELSNFSFSKKNIYLHWLETNINIKVLEGDCNDKQINALSIVVGENLHSKKEILELGLFDGNDPNDCIKQFYSQYVDLGINAFLKRITSNLILSGAPGTGKTYLAKEIAKIITSDTDENDHPHYEMVQFHPSYDYSDFVEGLRPVKDAKGNIGFERKDGVFKAFCKKALAKTDEKYVFIIDEINRGEMSKIFGELFFSIDPGYRGTKGRINTQYQNLIEDNDEFKNGFFVPENVYIIGTMNDIDRSVDSMDFAMRRRFAFKEVTANDRVDMWNGNMDSAYIDKAKECMECMNKAIENIPGLSSAYHIGPSYFLKLKEYNYDFNLLWEYHIKGVVEEYLRGMPDAKENLNTIHEAYTK